MEQKQLFNENVLFYDKHKPTYGEKLYNDVINNCALGGIKTAVEIGCGTG